MHASRSTCKCTYTCRWPMAIFFTLLVRLLRKYAMHRKCNKWLFAHHRAARACPKRPRRVLSIRPSQPAPRCLADSWQLGPIRHTTHLPGQLSVANRPLCSVQLSFRLVRRRAILHSPADQLGWACRILRLHDVLLVQLRNLWFVEQVCPGLVFSAKI